MFIGVDAGGTNTDGVLLSENGVVSYYKVPSSPNDIKSIEEVLKLLKKDLKSEDSKLDRIVIGTTLILNSIFESNTESCGCILLPGPGLNPKIAEAAEFNEIINGYVDHRGRVIEDFNKENVKNFKDKVDDEVGSYAVIGKFSTRNPELENKVAKLLDDRPISKGNEISSDLNFPKRSSTTVLNAKTKPIFRKFTDNIEEVLKELNIEAPIYFIKSDGAMLNKSKASEIPSSTIKSGPAVSTLGLYALTGVENALAIDIGGTTTDLGIISNSKPRIKENLEISDYKTFYPTIESVDIPLGGDSLVEVNSNEVKIRKRRKDKAAAFGGKYPTPTDALHYLGEFKEGEREKSEKAIKKLAKNTEFNSDELANEIIHKFSRILSEKTEKFIRNHETLNKNKNIKILGGGVLSKYIVPKISEKVDLEFLIPEYSDVAGAVGAAVSKVSIKTGIHIDTAKGKITVNGNQNSVKKGKKYSKEELKNLAKEKTLKISKEAGLKTENEGIEINHMRYFNVVNHRRVQGQICDIESQIKPGITKEINLKTLRGDYNEN